MRPYCRAHERLAIATAPSDECDDGRWSPPPLDPSDFELAPVDLLPETYMGMRAMVVGLVESDLPGWGTALDADDLIALHA